MELRVWRSFSCNNSSSYYLVGQFDNAEAARAAADALPAQFDELSEDEDFYLWPSDEEPSVWIAGSTVVVHHDYCGGLYEVTLAGAKTVEEEGSPQLGVMLELAAGKSGDEIRDQLAAFFAQADGNSDTSEWRAPPWSNARLPYADAETDVVWWTDGRHAGFSVRYRDDLDGLRRYLARPGIVDHQLLLCDGNHLETLRTLARHRVCGECGGALALSPASDTVPEDQLVCAQCGGMFALSSLASEGR